MNPDNLQSTMNSVSALMCTNRLDEDVLMLQLSTIAESLHAQEIKKSLDLDSIESFLGSLLHFKSDGGKNWSRHMLYIFHKCLAAAFLHLPQFLEQSLMTNILPLEDLVKVLEILSRNADCEKTGSFCSAVLEKCLGRTLQGGKNELFVRLLNIAVNTKTSIVALSEVSEYPQFPVRFSQIITNILAAEPGVHANDLINTLNDLFDYSGPCLMISKNDAPTWYGILAKCILDCSEKVMIVSGGWNFSGTALRNSCLCLSKASPIILLLKCTTYLVRLSPISHKLDVQELVRIILHLQQQCASHKTFSLPRFLCSIFADDDGILCEASLCFLHLSLMQAEKLLPDPVDMFDALLGLLSNDHYILVSWISDNQNCFLGYFLQYLKILDGSREIRRNQAIIFQKIYDSVHTLQLNGGFLFNVLPLLRRIRTVIEIQQEID